MKNTALSAENNSKQSINLEIRAERKDNSVDRCRCTGKHYNKF